MRAALPAADPAPAVIARIFSQRVDTAFALVLASVGPIRVAEQGEFRVNPYLERLLVAEKDAAPQECGAAGVR